ncbi:CoA transferase [Gordonia sp. X0973]|uniref:CaiB/BaiF CoA transferase family protein n=1 Tax=Gordonia sp. X0973 TaxID=2742602 RepID=UPI000F53E143|nr:CaiB/BaiF CoA-transferase family protein [Gordonia sp. X0973]QKT08475.1 CoA transferase [Gordonia sp. X0973]
MSGSGPLVGIRVIELGGVGPIPFACQLLADLGADIIRLDRPPGYDGGAPIEARFNLTNRSRRSAAVDLKNPGAAAAVLDLVRAADVLVEGFRPGVAERLGLGPEECMAANPRLVYGRMTGWGQDGPLAQAPGHDINYIAVTGALHAIGTAQRPVPPLNLAGDLGGGSLYLAFGVVAALLERHTSGRGQVVDAAMVDGAASLLTMFFGFHAAGYWEDARASNRLDSGAPFYDVYETSDGRWLAVGSNETRFWRNTLRLLGVDEEGMTDQHDKSTWPAMKERVAAAVATKTRDEWCALADGEEVCLAPVLSLSEAPRHPHLRERQTFVDVDGVVQPAPAPRFSRTPGAISRPPAEPGEHTDEVLADWGFSADRIAELRSTGVLR